MKSNIFAIVQSFQFIAHVLEEQAILLWIGLQSAFQQPQDKLHLKYVNVSICFLLSTLYRFADITRILIFKIGPYPLHRYNTFLVIINDVPCVLEVPYVGVW